MTTTTGNSVKLQFSWFFQKKSLSLLLPTEKIKRSMIFVVSIQNIISFAQSESNGKYFDHGS